ncbi:hypothetical protein [Streptomyces sp. NPDC056713]|uniref:hypothetical protein n=1 Tax=Streptomyces sp. NPDC056713 TaxID=3345921 RepID=UPI0036C5166D
MTYADIGARDTKKGKPYRAELAAQLGVSEKTLDRTVFEGECAGLWSVKPQTRALSESDDPKKINDANVYMLHDAVFWRGEWVDPLKPGEKAADVAKARIAERVEAKKAAGYEHKGGRKKKQVEGGVTHDATPETGGGVTHDATLSDMGDAMGGVMGDAHIEIPSVENPPQEPTSPPVRPSLPEGDPLDTDGRTNAGDSDVDQEEKRLQAGPSHSKTHLKTTPGAEILRRVGHRNEDLRLAGKVMVDQATCLDGLLLAAEAAGDPWAMTQLVDMLSAPLDGPIRRSAGAVVSGRIKRLPATPHALQGFLPEQPSRSIRNSAAAEHPSVDDEVNRRSRHECAGCGVDWPGGGYCGRCQGWPECDGGCGQFMEHAGTCEACEYADDYAAIKAVVPPTDDGVCPGFNGPCDRPVMTLGLCGKCRIKAEAAKRERDAQWAASVAQAAAAVEQAEHAPF